MVCCYVIDTLVLVLLHVVDFGWVGLWVLGGFLVLGFGWLRLVGFGCVVGLFGFGVLNVLG